MRPAIQGQDLVASARTGTGKTLGFTAPMIERFRGRSGTYGLILSPTREIAQQTFAVLEKFGKPLGISAATLIGGIDMRYDLQALQTYPHILVATPGRLVDHLERGNVWLDFIEIVALDEADQMLNMGFADQLNRIMSAVPENAQKLLFSATIPPEVEKIARKFMHEPLRVQIGAAVSAAKSVEQHFLYVTEEEKFRRLRHLLTDMPGSTIVFTRSKDTAARLWLTLHSYGFHDAIAIHSNLQQKHREQALAGFKAGTSRILIATDVAGRGIHVDNVAHVINYELPMEAEEYVHRIGRTGRVDQKGLATSFVTMRDRRDLKDLERVIGRPIEVKGAPAGFWPADPNMPMARGKFGRPHGRRRPSTKSSSKR